ncbi:MAG TPA: glutamate synthase large subunit [Candidatus Limnocylindrales bacterium]|nr:glutamate synthase large subunit [Candidatus Limnocylindrales bacterium]
MDDPGRIDQYRDEIIPAAPLYDPAFEHDACGVGFVAESRGGPSERVVPLALEALARMAHRGATAADARTSDGSGLALPLSAGLVDRLTRRIALGGRNPDQLAIGTVFLPLAAAARGAALGQTERAIAAEGLDVLGWRPVPVDPGVLGDQAAASLPVIRQVVAARPAAMAPAEFEQRLFFARRSIERGAATTAGLEALHLPSLSSRTIVYKGLVRGADLGAFYADLRSPGLAVDQATFHQRFSTNTRPTWRLAQPFRYLAHNGEINTVRGNRQAMAGRSARLGGGAFGRRLARETRLGQPILDPAGSDSASLDEALELLLMAGWSLAAALTALVPEAAALRDTPVAGLEGWQRTMATRLEPWDGPAALVFSDGRQVGALLDRNGLRPAAWEIRRDGLVILASEAGLLPAGPGEIVRRGRLGPGEILVVDPAQGLILDDEAAKGAAIAAMASTSSPAPAGPDVAVQPVPTADRVVLEAPQPATDPDTTRRRRIALGLDAEQLRLTVAAMATTGREPLWSMGDDTPPAFLGRRARGVAGYLRQAFAQVTNPPIDPERERLVMSLAIPLGPRPALLDLAAGHPRPALVLDPPVIGAAALRSIIECGRDGWQVRVLDASWPVRSGEAGLRRAVERLVRSGLRAARGGADVIVVTDAGVGPARAGVPSLLAIGALNAALTAAGRRDRTDLLADAGDAFDIHAVAMLLAAGASAVHPREAMAAAREQAGSRGHETLGPDAAEAHLVGALDSALRKVLARMGISTLAAYRGGHLFEVLGLSDEVARLCFPAAPAFPGSAGFERLAADLLARHAAAYAPERAPALSDPGFARFRSEGELHVFAPVAVKAIQALAGPDGNRPADRLAAYRSVIDRSQPALVRDLFRIEPADVPIDLDQVEPAPAITARFVSSAMSLGALSPEAHRTIAIGMRRLGAASNTGEGGEDEAWYQPDENGELAESAIKQVASARFGVTARYLARAEQLEIKIAQGSKPGEGGQLPAAKATAFIAALRRGRPGATMISPPPHHDIYSIEDLAQLIGDLRAINPGARIGVKLVAGSGVGTIAAGVAKAHADYILIAGHAGGTGASPLSSIKSVGLPWELGLAEAHQVLIRQRLRDRVVLRTDGGLQTGRDVLIAALLGAEEYGFGTAALVAIGCDMARQCHLDTCPTGIATQREELRAKFTGTPEQVVAFFSAIAEDVRRELAAAGFTGLDEAIGRIDRLGLGAEAPLELERVSGGPAWQVPAGRRAPGARRRPIERSVAPASELEAGLVARLAGPATGRIVDLAAEVTTAERTLGAAVSGVLERARDNGQRHPAAIRLRLSGAAGQSLGAFLTRGVRIELTGVANDYAGKGLSGGTLIVRTAADQELGEGDAIAGNTCLYGATAGRLHLVGAAGMRFGVRNSGATAVIEGMGAHGAEYMTGGTIVVLGRIGRNAGAGMTGGRLWLYDEDGRARTRLNRGSVAARGALEVRAAGGDDAAAVVELRELVADHAEAGSSRATALLLDWNRVMAAFLLVEPVDAAPTTVAQPAASYPATAPLGSATVVGSTSRSGSVQDQAAPWNLPTAP